MAKDDDKKDSVTVPADFMERLTRAFEVMATRGVEPSQDRQTELMELLTQAFTSMTKAQLEGANVIARAQRPSNQIIPGVSVFNRRGETLPDYSKPRLKCLMLLPWIAEWESLTREEVELLNLLEAGEYKVKRIDNSPVKLSVHIDYGVDNITPSRLLINHETAFNNTNRGLMPSLVEMVRQMLRQHPPLTKVVASKVMSDEEEEALIEAGELSVSV